MVAPAFIPELRAQQQDPGGAHFKALGDFYNGLKHGDKDLHGKRSRASETMKNYHALLKRDGSIDEIQQNINRVNPLSPPRPTLSQAMDITNTARGNGVDLTYSECVRSGLQMGRTHTVGHWTLAKKAGAQRLHDHAEFAMDHLPLPPKGRDYLGDARVRGIFRPAPVPLPPGVLSSRASLIRVQDDQAGCPCYCDDGTLAWNNYGGGCPVIPPPPDDESSDQYAQSASTVYIDPVPNPYGLEIDPVSASIYTVVTPDVQGGMQPGWVDRYNNWSTNMAEAPVDKKLPPEDCNALKILTIIYTTMFNVCRLVCKWQWNAPQPSYSCICAVASAVSAGAGGIAIVKYC